MPHKPQSKEDRGDVLFVLGIREQGDLAAARGVMGRVDLVGGTGKYANPTGECSYETRYLSTSTAVTSYDCAWSKPWAAGESRQIFTKVKRERASVKTFP